MTALWVSVVKIHRNCVLLVRGRSVSYIEPFAFSIEFSVVFAFARSVFTRLLTKFRKGKLGMAFIRQKSMRRPIKTTNSTTFERAYAISDRSFNVRCPNTSPINIAIQTVYFDDVSSPSAQSRLSCTLQHCTL